MSRRARLESVVQFLCSRECNGRGPGTPGSDAARARIVSELRGSGVETSEQTVPGCGTNVLARIPGSGALAERAVVVAAHYDHLGHVDGETYWGADDNAAAVGILLDVAARLEPPEVDSRQIVLAGFDGEEPPHFAEKTMGSMYYASHPSVPLAQTDMMICMDLMGHALGPESLPDEVRQSVFVLGAELSEGTPALVDSLRARGIYPRRMGLDVIPPLSDYYAFVENHVPVLFLTCGRWEHYHAVTDTPEKLDYDKMLAASDFLKELVELTARRKDAPVTFLPDGRDDRAHVSTLIAMADLLEPYVPQVQFVRPSLDVLAAAAEEGPLAQEHRDQLSQLVLLLEEVLM